MKNRNVECFNLARAVVRSRNIGLEIVQCSDRKWLIKIAFSDFNDEKSLSYACLFNLLIHLFLQKVLAKADIEKDKTDDEISIRKKLSGQWCSAHARYNFG